MKSAKDKQNLIEQLKKTPIVQLACEKTGIGRATYYRWRKDDSEFAKAADTALSDGALLINDMAESQLISAIKDKNITAIIYWLRHHHSSYANRLEVSAQWKRVQDELTPEQETTVKEALRLAAVEQDDQTEPKQVNVQTDQQSK